MRRHGRNLVNIALDRIDFPVREQRACSPPGHERVVPVPAASADSQAGPELLEVLDGRLARAGTPAAWRFRGIVAGSVC